MERFAFTISVVLIRITISILYILTPSFFFKNYEILVLIKFKRLLKKSKQELPRLKFYLNVSIKSKS